uniref:lysine-specific demethylase 8-like isoform X2 n=1 Tax=Ciona intestinalis TaxID=7719 RepID=UPI000EF43D5A|nr:lysine-specific demethylase 8-like isoform X2 [Ciona intestinalis]|eukprot:XP_026689371.1 lysine-specific demethylase 8-like isoform X2 [Ciona intestinalis]
MNKCIIIISCIVQLAVVVVVADDPPGHMQPIGSHMPPMPIEERDDLPNPTEFYDNYVTPGKPVVFKGVVKKFPNFNNLRNDSYLRDLYGDTTFNTDKLKEEVIDKPFPMKMYEFLSVYEKEDVYLIDPLSDGPFANTEVFVPKPLLCEKVLNMIVIWFSSGNSKSLLHNDAYDNLNCLYDGSKDLLLIDQKYEDSLPLDVLPDQVSNMSSLDVEKVDMYKYGKLSNIPWYGTTIEAGDCFYIPIKWFHQLKGPKGRNLAINYWLNMKNDPIHREDCVGIFFPEYKTYSQYRTDPVASLENKHKDTSTCWTRMETMC